MSRLNLFIQKKNNVLWTHAIFSTELQVLIVNALAPRPFGTETFCLKFSLISFGAPQPFAVEEEVVRDTRLTSYEPIWRNFFYRRL